MSDTTRTIVGRYSGTKGELFNLALVTSLLTLVTLGIYRFWAKTRIRKYIWSSVDGSGDKFEYTGTGIEKLLGFLVAVVILAIYLGLIQMILFYFGLNLFREPITMAEAVAQMAAFYISFFAVVPLIFFAQYRARRYKLARSRWRGVRFGAEPAAWGYVIRAIGHWLLTILTLGLLLPRQTFYLEKYMTDRSWYGTARFEQNGRWQALYPAMTHLIIGALIVVLAVVMLAVSDSPAIGTILLVVGYFWAMIGLVSYRIRSFAYLTGQKRLDDTIGFRADPETSTVIGHVILGGLLVGLVTGVMLFAVGAIVAVLVGPAAMGGSAIGVVLALILYLGTLVIASALSLVWITQPIIDHIVSSMAVENADVLDGIRQRAMDSGADDEGFADALDVGGAI